MTCKDFLTRYSEFRDGNLPDPDMEVFESHVGSCGPCERYHRVVNRGVTVLRDEPSPRLREDFRDRLRHSLYTLDEERRIRRHRPQGASGPGAMFVVAAAVLVLAVVWTPALWEATPSVELEPVVAERPVEREPTSATPGLFALPAEARTRPVYEQDLWSGANALLFEYSALYHRHREPSLVRAGIQ